MPAMPPPAITTSYSISNVLTPNPRRQRSTCWPENSVSGAFKIFARAIDCSAEKNDK
jgi:hypothetical protein